jgi:hypothetical protein
MSLITYRIRAVGLTYRLCEQQSRKVGSCATSKTCQFIIFFKEGGPSSFYSLFNNIKNKTFFQKSKYLLPYAVGVYKLGLHTN